LGGRDTLRALDRPGVRVGDANQSTKHCVFRDAALASDADQMARLQAEGSVIGSSTRIVGRVSGDGALRVEGNIRGDVQVGGEAEIAEGAAIEGNVAAEALEISGSLLGDAVARGPIAVRSGAVVRGELRGSEVSIEPGSRISVRLETEFDLDFGPAKRR